MFFLMELFTVGAGVAALIGSFVDGERWYVWLPLMGLGCVGWFVVTNSDQYKAQQRVPKVKSAEELAEKERKHQENLAKLAAYRQAKADAKNPTICPKCRSRNSEVLGSTNKASIGRAIVGDVVAGVPGAMVGAMTGKKQRHEFICRDCGHRWIVK